MVKKLYHFYVASIEDGHTHHFDGTITTSANLRELYRYDELRKDIASNMTPPCNPDNIIIMSLSVIDTIDEE